MKPNLLFKELDIKAMPQIEVEKMLNVLVLRKRKGYSQFELSFLMGQRDFYVRDAENPNHTLIYAVPFTNIFRQIYGCDTKAIVPDINKKPDYSIRILEATDESGNSVYRAEKKIEGGNWELIDTFSVEPKELLLKSPSRITDQQVKDWVNIKFNSGYFDVAKNALQILKDCEKELESTIRPLFLADALKDYTLRKKAPRLAKKKDENGRFVFGLLRAK
ncbi:hypothetical protein [Parapedobacter koreensis]|uniref:Uncharacterized protein n=1 Tax=Parapedobacter koreensis TaxID=332977 RepID=A0A1H7RC79_9SPHI|nr:hypothetical protein [Parapedobacter koreensis]SEL57514.1 hypothetical protein SAMN05421740_10710 [Parapedobacter koreensis]